MAGAAERSAVDPNGCIPMFGPGPEGSRCGGCLRLRLEHAPDGSSTYYCGISDGVRRVTSDSCGMYIEALAPEILREAAPDGDR